MTDPATPPGPPGPPDDGRDGSAAAARQPEQPAARQPDEPAAPGSPSRPGTRTFTIEGRSAPGLFVGGWIATLVGLGIVVPAIASGGAVPAPLVVVGLGILSLGLIAGAGSQAIERRARGAPFDGPSPFLLFAAVIVVSLFLSVLVGIVFELAGIGVGDTPIAALASTLVLLVTYIGLVRLEVVGISSLSWRDLGLRLPVNESASSVAFAVLLAVPLVFVSGLLGQLLTQFLPTPPSPLPEATDRAGLLLNLVAGAVIAPIGEEIFFRGYATTAWLRAIGPERAIIRGAIFFAFAHVLTLSGDTFGAAVGQALFAFVVRLPVAFALGWLFVRTRSVVPTIALHAAFNGLPLVLLFLRG